MAIIFANQIGYQCKERKIAVFKECTKDIFTIIDIQTGHIVYQSNISMPLLDPASQETILLGDFSPLTAPGTYQIILDENDSSYPFTIDQDIYLPLLKDLCRRYYNQHFTSSVPAAAISIATIFYALEANFDKLIFPIQIMKQKTLTPDLLTIIRAQLCNLNNALNTDNKLPFSLMELSSYTAVMAMSVPFFTIYDPEFSKQCHNIAIKHWKQLIELTNTMNEGSDSINEALYWPSAQLYKLTGDKCYHDTFVKLVTQKVHYGHEPSHNGSFGNRAYLTTNYPVDPNIITLITEFIKEKSRSLLSISLQNGYGISTEETIDSMNCLSLLKQSIMLYNGFLITRDSAYLHAIQSHLDYLLGKNPQGQCYVPSYGSKFISEDKYMPEITAPLIYLLAVLSD